MNLYLRLFWMFLSARFKTSVSALDDFETDHRVQPNDLDLLGHMNNGRYFTIADIARIELLIRSGLWQAMKQRSIFPVLAGESVQFRKPLMPFDKYRIVTRTLGWDRRFIYIEHCFRSSNTVHALMLVKVEVIGEGDIRVTPKQILALVGSGDLDSTQMDEVIDRWNDSSQLHWNQR